MKRSVIEDAQLEWVHHVIRLYQRRWPQEYQSDLHQSHPHKTKQTTGLTRTIEVI